MHHYNSTQYCKTETVFSIFPSSRPTSHLRCGQVEVRGVQTFSSAVYILNGVVNQLVHTEWSWADNGRAAVVTAGGRSWRRWWRHIRLERITWTTLGFWFHLRLTKSKMTNASLRVCYTYFCAKSTNRCKSESKYATKLHCKKPPESNNY